MAYPLEPEKEISIQSHSGISTLLSRNPIPFHFAFCASFLVLIIIFIIIYALVVCICSVVFPSTNHLCSILSSHLDLPQFTTMKDSSGPFDSCPSLKSLSNKVGGMLSCHNPPNKYKRLDAKLERKMMEVKKSTSGTNSFKSINGIILRFPQIKEGLKDIRGVFQQCDEDSNGTIGREELKKCLKKLQLNFTEKEIRDLFYYCDVDGNAGIQFKEFIVLLCLIYLLVDHLNSPHTTSKLGSPQVEATFDTIIEAFLFLDKNGDGKLNKKDMIKALNDDTPREKSPTHITRNRFKEMDWDRNGKVSFREFLFSLIDWVGIDTEDENHVAASLA